jgi:cbb3-type cytochrome oxidase subunit 3
MAMTKSLFTFILLWIAVVPAAYSSPAKAEETENAELAKMFAEDQAIRDEISERGGWVKVKDDKAFLVRWQTEDAVRLLATQKLLEAGTLKSGLDFYRAAFIFQHGQRSEDFLKAHHLAVIAISKGYDARWISAATLDRYLQATGKRQIYGTQSRSNDVGEYVREPVEVGIVNDTERNELNVPALTDED